MLRKLLLVLAAGDCCFLVHTYMLVQCWWLQEVGTQGCALQLVLARALLGACPCSGHTPQTSQERLPHLDYWLPTARPINDQVSALHHCAERLSSSLQCSQPTVSWEEVLVTWAHIIAHLPQIHSVTLKKRRHWVSKLAAQRCVSNEARRIAPGDSSSHELVRFAL